MAGLEDIYGVRAALYHSRSSPPYESSFLPTTEPGVSPRRQWSVFTNYTLADFPMLSVIPLPVTSGEIRDGSVFYTFDYARDASQESDETPPSTASTHGNHPPTPPEEPVTAPRDPSEDGKTKKKRLAMIVKLRRLRRIIV